jgi:hypothetical protein
MGVLLVELKTWKAETTVKLNNTPIKLSEERGGDGTTDFKVTARFIYPQKLIDALWDEAYHDPSGHADMKEGYQQFIEMATTMGYSYDEYVDTEGADVKVVEWGCGIDICNKISLPETAPTRNANLTTAMDTVQKLITDLPKLRKTFDDISSKLGYED